MLSKIFYMRQESFGLKFAIIFAQATSLRFKRSFAILRICLIIKRNFYF
jgi:hypothetical protein